MKKGSMRAAVCMAVLLVMYLLLAFLAPRAVVWVSFAFAVAAFGVAGYSIYMAFFKNPDARSRYYGFPIARIGVTYGFTQLALSFLVLALGRWIPVWAAVVVYVLLLAAAIVGMIGADTAADEIQHQDDKLKKNVAFMRALQSQVNQMAAQSGLPEVKQFSEDVRYSDPVSSPALAEIEGDLTAVVNELQTAIVDGDSGAALLLTQKAENLLRERNRLCKLNKG